MLAARCASADDRAAAPQAAGMKTDTTTGAAAHAQREAAPKVSGGDGLGPSTKDIFSAPARLRLVVVVCAACAVLVPVVVGWRIDQRGIHTILWSVLWWCAPIVAGAAAWAHRDAELI